MTACRAILEIGLRVLEVEELTDRVERLEDKLTTATEIHSHLRHDLFAEKAFDVVTVDLSKPAGDVVSLRDVSGPNGHTMGKSQEANALEQLA